MSARQRTISFAAFGAALFLSLASVAGAQQEQPLFQWRGQVDREAEIVMRGGRISTRYANGERSRYTDRVEGSIPGQDGTVNVQLQRGRGQVSVVQQPTSQNGYTTIVRILDTQPGADSYQLRAYWESAYANNGRGYGRGGRYGHDSGNYPRRGGDDHDRGEHRGGDRGYGNSQGGYGQGGYGAGYGSGTAHWTGTVDDVVDIRIQGNRVDYSTVSGNQAYNVRSNVSGGALPQGARVSVRENSGRGSVMVIQQPSPQNGNTAIVRISDRSAGSAYYDLQISW